MASQNRLNGLESSILDLFTKLSDGDTRAFFVLTQWYDSSKSAHLEMLMLDTKRLYDARIWELYRLCGEGIERFKYHIQVELPNQETGELTVTGPYSPDFDDYEFWEKRCFGKPGSFWALEPPNSPFYDYPIK